ncbi:uncharacterized protein LOC135398480 [Ornithodoros turicata]|uniref:uncharacterized protein LOC135398480 n=1 Tax=Ornithodoros turicata TaxID=34597 RepID=UPI003139DAF5
MKIGVEPYDGMNADQISSQLQVFWDLEHLGITENYPPFREIDDPVLKGFRSSARLQEGRYVVRLPWDTEKSHRLADNKTLALQRLGHITKKLLLDSALMEEYDMTIRQYLLNDHAEHVREPESPVSGPIYYMPHHTVIRRDRETTKVRIVFDASSKMPGEVSLNETLHAGPDLNSDVLDLLMQFRAHQIALTADVEKAFLHIALDPCDRDALRFLWYETTPKASQPLPRVETWRMTRVPFGAKSSPFLLAVSITHHLQSAAAQCPETAALLSTHFYVDDLVVAVGSSQEASLLYRQARDILLEAGMKLVKWTSNDMKLRTLFQDEGTTSMSTTPLRKVLGLNWDIDSDEIQLSVKSLTEFLERRADTKRYVLQAVSRTYDPLGYVAPYVITAKILLQRIWLAKLQWDDQLPEALMNTWHRWCQEVTMLSDFRVPRRLSGASAPLQESTQSLHVFSDASTKAYGAAVYLVLQSDDGNIEISIVLAKARVPPSEP